MADNAAIQRDLSARCIIGFACAQAFIFLTPLGGSKVQLPFERFDLACTLLFMVLGFASVRLLGSQRVSALLARPLLYIYAVAAPVGLLSVMLLPEMGLAGIALQGALVGVSSSFLLTAWGRAFGGRTTQVSVPEVFLGSLVGSLVFLVFSFVESPVAVGAACLLPLASVVNIEVPGDDEHGDPLRPAGSVSTADDGETSMLSAKILAGTLFFGVAAGLVSFWRQSVGADGSAFSSDQVSFILFGAFLIGALSLLLSDGFGRGAALNKSYRLAVFVMMAGVLLVPWPPLADSVLPGEAVVLAGYLGLEAVLISLFLVLAEVAGADCAISFSAGFSALFGGELVGLLVAVAVPAAFPAPSVSYAVIVLAGVLILFSYVFLFTERDFDALSKLVSESDTFDETCATIVERYALSKREAEILAFALRGRTSERIAQEFVISKSTVDTHLRRIYAKCGVHSRQELLDLANL